MSTAMQPVSGSGSGAGSAIRTRPSFCNLVIPGLPAAMIPITVRGPARTGQLFRSSFLPQTFPWYNPDVRSRVDMLSLPATGCVTSFDTIDTDSTIFVLCTHNNLAFFGDPLESAMFSALVEMMKEREKGRRGETERNFIIKFRIILFMVTITTAEGFIFFGAAIMGGVVGALGNLLVNAFFRVIPEKGASKCLDWFLFILGVILFFSILFYLLHEFIFIGQFP
jgi:hypothetical protein